MKHKGVVVEIAPKNKVIVMTAQGEFVKVPFKKHVHVGQEIRFAPKKERLNTWQLGLAATLFLALLGTWPLFTEHFLPAIMPAFVITLDINPSLELKVSQKQRVLEVAGLNREGNDFIAQLAVVGEDLKTALEQIALDARQKGYLNQRNNQVIVTIASHNDAEAILMELKTRRSDKHGQLVQTITEALTGTQLAQVKIWQVPMSLQQEAKLAGITPSRYIAIQTPVQQVVPQRQETRLTMNDLPEIQEQPASLSLIHTLQANAEPVRPNLAPSRWTRERSSLRSTEAYNVSFPIVSQAKGEFQLYR